MKKIKNQCCHHAYPLWRHFKTLSVILVIMMSTCQCVRDVILINVVYEDHQLFMNQHLFNPVVTCIEDDAETCLLCMFQSEVSGHCLQSC